MEQILALFPFLSPLQIEQFRRLEGLYTDWNQKINVISRKDMDCFYVHHVLHSLGIAKVIDFKPNAHVLDVGTGGGFPGIPLAILFPETHFYLIDSIGKKIKVVNAVAEALELKNIKATQQRAEQVNEKFDFIVSRAVTALPEFCSWVKSKIAKQQNHELQNGILYLKGGDFMEELEIINARYTIYNLSQYFDNEFFETKKLVHITQIK